MPAKEVTMVKTILGIAAFTVTLTTAVLIGGVRIGQTEGGFIALKEDVIKVEGKVDKQDEVIHRMDKELGVVSSKVEAIYEIVSKWEPN